MLRHTYNDMKNDLRRTRRAKDPKHLAMCVMLQRLRFLTCGGYDPVHVGDRHPGMRVSHTQARHNLFLKLGVTYKNDRIPPDAKGTFEIDGFIFKLYPGQRKNHVLDLESPPPTVSKHHKWARRAHRLYVICPVCPAGKLIPIGRLGQHAQIHTTLMWASASEIGAI